MIHQLSEEAKHQRLIDLPRHFYDSIVQAMCTHWKLQITPLDCLAHVR